MHRLTFEPARPIDTDSMPWIPTGPGKSFRPLRFAAGSWSELMRLEPGSAVAVHRHTGEVHAFNLTGTREIFGTGERVGPGSYVYEPAGTIDGWAAIGGRAMRGAHQSHRRYRVSRRKRPGHRIHHRRHPGARCT